MTRTSLAYYTIIVYKDQRSWRAEVEMRTYSSSLGTTLFGLTHAGKPNAARKYYSIIMRYICNRVEYVLKSG